MNDKTIGIVGLGYVGEAIHAFFSSTNKILTFDINKDCSEISLMSLVQKSDIIFLCLPTPMDYDGSCSIDTINHVLNEINSNSKENEFAFKTFIIKSTIPPGSTEDFIKKYKNLNIIFNPEFLTEKNFINDFKFQNRIVLGCKNNYNEIYNLYKNYFPEAEIFICSPSEAEMIKYFSNCMLALKVSFSNEFYTLCDALNIDFNRIVDISSKDERIGKSHMQVPGPDMKRGFGGTCFPKDLSAIIKVFEKNKIDSYILKAAWERNQKIDRPEKDWEKLKGRAII